VEYYKLHVVDAIFYMKYYRLHIESSTLHVLGAIFHM
jgi:hypothetical protein